MVLRFVTCALLFVFVGSSSVALADDVALSAAERAKNIKAYQARKAQGLETDSARGGRGAAGQQPQRAQQQPRAQQPQRAQQEAMQRAKRCQEAMNDAQNTAMGASVASSVVGFIPFGGAASSVVGAAAGVGSMAAGEVARQKMAAGC